MRGRILVLSAVLAAAILAAPASTANDTRFTASIAGKPGVSGVFLASLAGAKLTWRLTLRGLATPLTTQIRSGRAGSVVGTLCRACSQNARGTTAMTPAAVRALTGGTAFIDVHGSRSSKPRVLARIVLGVPTLRISSLKDGDTLTLPAQIDYTVTSFQVGPAPFGHLQAATPSGAGALAIPVSAQSGTAVIPDTKRWLLGTHDLTFSLVTSAGTRVPNPEASITIRNVTIVGRR